MGLTDYRSVQLHKKWSVELLSENYSYSYIKNGFRTKNVMISNRMVVNYHGCRDLLSIVAS